MAEARAAKLAAIDLLGLDALAADSIALFVPEEAAALGGVAGLVDWRLGGLIGQAQAAGHFGGAQDERLILPAPSRLRRLTVLVAGLGPVTGVDAHALTGVASRAVAVAHAAGCRRLALAVPALMLGMPCVNPAAVLLALAAASLAPGAATSAHIIVKVLALKVD